MINNLSLNTGKSKTPQQKEKKLFHIRGQIMPRKISGFSAQQMFQLTQTEQVSMITSCLLTALTREEKGFNYLHSLKETTATSAFYSPEEFFASFLHIPRDFSPVWHQGQPRQKLLPRWSLIQGTRDTEGDGAPQHSSLMLQSQQILSLAGKMTFHALVDYFSRSFPAQHQVRPSLNHPL